MFALLSGLLERRPVIVQLLRFIAIGALNTAIDFVILNFLTESLRIEAGTKLGFINIVGTTAAIAQSYYWNKYWAFAAGGTVSLVKQFVGVVLVGALGFCAFVAAVLPSLAGVLTSHGVMVSVQPSPLYFGMVLLFFLLLQIVIAVNIGFHGNTGADSSQTAASELGKFIGVSVVGVIINSVVLTVFAGILLSVYPTIVQSLAKNAAKFIAVFFALSWNFIGYKFFVFKK